MLKALQKVIKAPGPHSNLKKILFDSSKFGSGPYMSINNIQADADRVFLYVLWEGKCRKTFG